MHKPGLIRLVSQFSLQCSSGLIKTEKTERDRGPILFSQFSHATQHLGACIREYCEKRVSVTNLLFTLL